MTYQYSIATDFSGGLNSAQLQTEIIVESEIIPAILRIDTGGDDIFIVFASSLSAGEQTTLDGLVAAHVPNPNRKGIVGSEYIDIITTLADGAALRISASDPVGGITIDAGNQISIDAGGASNFTTSVGNLTFGAGGTVNIDGTGGINIGSNPDAQAINIGSSASSRTLNIGNQNTSTVVNILGGTGGILADTTGPISLDANGTSSNFTLTTTGDGQHLTIALVGGTNSSLILDSAGTGANAIRFNTAGGIDADAAGLINFATSSSAGGAITLDAAFNNGGITLSSGSQGIAINAGGGLIGIGHWNGGNIDIGTAAVARTITVGNTTGATQLRMQYGTGGRVYHNASAPTSLSDADATLTIAQLKTEIVHMTPTADRTLTMPTAALAVGGVPGATIGDRIEFVIINESTTNDTITLAIGTGGTLVGSAAINPALAGVHIDPGSGKYIMRLTNVTASSEAYTVYRS